MKPASFPSGGEGGSARAAAADVVLFAGPRCGDTFFADLEPDEEPLELEAEEWRGYSGATAAG